MHVAEVDLNENSDAEENDHEEEEESDSAAESEQEEEEEGDPSEFIDVLDVLDGRGGPDIDQASKDRKGKPVGGKTKDNGESEEAMDEDDSHEGYEDGEEENSVVPEPDSVMIEADEDEVDESALDNLDTFITGLDTGKKRKVPEDADATDAQSEEPQKRKRRMLKEQTQVGAENEFAAQAGA